MGIETIQREPRAMTAADRAMTARHFVIMDGLRGVAALAVVLFHSFKGGGAVPNGPVAVDLFFILSGFVIAYSYDDRLATMPKRAFLLARFVRLYPMMLIGAAGGIVIAVLHNIVNPAEAYDVHKMLLAGGLSLVALPYLDTGLGIAGIFPFNAPIWSLFFEIVANVAYLLLARFLSIRILTAITLIVSVALWGGQGGGGVDSFFGGFPRVAAGFFGGVLLFRLWRGGHLPAVRAGFVPLSFAVLALVCCPVPLLGWLFVPAFAAMWLIVLAATDWRPSRLDGACRLLGTISYPVYLLHWLTIYVATWIGGKLGLTGDRYGIVVVLHFLAIPFIGYAAARFYETPMRRWLGRRLLPPRGPGGVKLRVEIGGQSL